MKAWNKLMAGAVLAAGMCQGAQAAEKVTVFAAASLTNALQEIAAQYQQGKDVRIVTSFASSSTLARQIDQGAPADLFISADQKWMDYAIDKQAMVANTRYTLLGNQLVLVAPADSKLGQVTIDAQTPWKTLLDGGRLAVGDPDHVPAGIYAKESLQKLGAWQTLAPLMARANDVRAALVLVERGETPLGIVYGSDAVASKKVKVVGVFPADSHKPVEYPMAIVKGKQSPAVDAFYDYLKGPQAATIFTRYGFTPR
ncbi:molybdate ABC transporter substrate-binding protein [Edwardsiella hoshinae]|uniref:Molybdate ABC transporter substrate-binding protein n=1 Tax=Edwardsiella hoshinae TaxID=93378 RepID=A0A376DAB6_9GAMM|nr:molybdate ABC transporter substrate-binding protein [Edwardsiella hoshinae]AOV96287.1 molybdate ABC transporter substrate-binding protein [Edwardsiella hoshinae]QPR27830.1 molybdate ABC transporter substrate-binding protein [Edwardsiella hoshinae]STC85852.1 Molybdate-binding periplasmic protein precursor [Edwardsiella hoshinae]